MLDLMHHLQHFAAVTSLVNEEAGEHRDLRLDGFNLKVCLTSAYYSVSYSLPFFSHLSLFSYVTAKFPCATSFLQPT